jgi:two-component system, OmpR family, alkaline phosphatase synthesis response regulator PhoP
MRIFAVTVEQYTGSTILLVEDEESLAIGLEYNLTAEGYRVVHAADGRQALAAFSAQSFDLIILDIMLPYIDGFQVAEKMREQEPQLPILMLTARKAAKDRIQGLQTGADDYMTKPFHLEELLLRVKGMLRRKTWYREETGVPALFSFGGNEVNFNTLLCRRGEATFKLTPHEAMVLRYLIAHAGRIVSRKELLENVWQLHAEMETRTIDNFIMRLRKYFEKDPGHPTRIISIRGAGYMFTAG